MNSKQISRMSVCLLLALLAISCAAPAPAPAQPGPAAPGQPQAPLSQAGKPSYTPGPDDSYIFFLEPLDGDSVSDTVAVRFGVSRLDLTDRRVFLVIDQACVAAGQAMTTDAQHRAYEQGLSGLAIELSAGQHRLCLQVANNTGIVLDGPGMLQVIDITVE